MAYRYKAEEPTESRNRRTYDDAGQDRRRSAGNRGSSRDNSRSAKAYPKQARPGKPSGKPAGKPAGRPAPRQYKRPEAGSSAPRPAASFRDYEYTEPRPASSYLDYEYTAPEKEEASENMDQYILTGRNPIREALKNNRDLEKLLVQKGELSGSAMEIVKTAKDRKILVQVVEKSRLDEIAPRHQGLIAFASAFKYSTVEEILKSAEEKNEDPFLILLDGITDPHNLGAIIRSAECTGAHGIIVPLHRSVGLTPAAVKSSAGAVEYIPIARVTNLNRTIEELQKKHIWVYALSMDGTDYEKVSFTGGTAVVIGAEGAGISRLTEEKCDMTVSLPMKGHLDSLNASVAAGVIMYRIMSSRRGSH